MYSKEIHQGDSAMIYRTEELMFIWKGGAYIDVYYPAYDVASGRTYGWVISDLNINVWDYNTDMVDMSIRWDDPASFIAECEEWIKENG